MKITLDAAEATMLVLTLGDVIALSKRRKIDGEPYILLHAETITHLVASVHKLIKTSELERLAQQQQETPAA
jgi:hypothetical protein